MHRLRLWITRQRNGLYCLTHRRPTIATLGSTGEPDVYVTYGDGVGLRNVCPWFARAVLGVGELEFGVPTRVWLAGGEGLGDAPRSES